MTIWMTTSKSGTKNQSRKGHTDNVIYMAAFSVVLTYKRKRGNMKKIFKNSRNLWFFIFVLMLQRWQRPSVEVVTGPRQRHTSVAILAKRWNISTWRKDGNLSPRLLNNAGIVLQTLNLKNKGGMSCMYSVHKPGGDHVPTL